VAKASKAKAAAAKAVKVVVASRGIKVVAKAAVAKAAVGNKGIKVAVASKGIKAVAKVGNKTTEAGATWMMIFLLTSPIFC